MIFGAWALVVVASTSTGLAIDTVYFESKSLCIAAQQEINKTPNLYAKGQCFRVKDQLITKDERPDKESVD